MPLTNGAIAALRVWVTTRRWPEGMPLALAAVTSSLTTHSVSRRTGSVTTRRDRVGGRVRDVGGTFPYQRMRTSVSPPNSAGSRVRISSCIATDSIDVTSPQVAPVIGAYA